MYCLGNLQGNHFWVQKTGIKPMMNRRRLVLLILEIRVPTMLYRFHTLYLSLPLYGDWDVDLGDSRICCNRPLSRFHHNGFKTWLAVHQ